MLILQETTWNTGVRSGILLNSSNYTRVAELSVQITFVSRRAPHYNSAGLSTC